MTHSDPDPYEGLCIDLLKRLAKDLQFKYTLELVSDNKYGSYDETTKKWSGMVGDLIEEVRTYVVYEWCLAYTGKRCNVFSMDKFRKIQT